MYIAATNRVVSVVLVVERREEGKEQPVQRPVYYLSEVLSQSKQNYPHYQKMVYGVHYAAKRLRHYFQEHPITVVCAAPLADIISNKNATGRVAKWAIELAAHSILYEPRTAIKIFKSWPISSSTGQKPSTCHRVRIAHTGGCTLTAPR